MTDNPDNLPTSQPQIPQQPPPNGRGQKYRKVDKRAALKLRQEHNLSYQQIATLQGVHPSAIHQALRKLLPTEETEVYKKNRADIISHMGLRLLKSIDDEDIKGAPLGSRILAYAQLYDKERLERGQASDIIEFRTISLDLNKAIDALLQEQGQEKLSTELSTGGESTVIEDKPVI